MINSREIEDVRAKEEVGGNGADHETKMNSKVASSSSSSSSWSRRKDPRIVRVSRAFGGKDRHSKVCTVRGLRDRRVRLSVPTAIQLYDLQDRLGLNQPSKAVDWLLNAAKHEIDDLPPLQLPPPNFNQLQPARVLLAAAASHGLVSGAPPPPPQKLEAPGGFRISSSNGINWPSIIEPSTHNMWPKPNKNQVLGIRESNGDEDGLGKQCHNNFEDSFYTSSSSCNNTFFSRHISGGASTTSSNLVHNSPIYTSLIRWDPSSTLSLSKSGSPGQGHADHHHGHEHHGGDFHNFNVHHHHVPLASSAPTVLMSSMPSSGGPHHHQQQQLLLYQPTGHHVTQSYFPNSHISTTQSAASGTPFHFISTTNNLNHHGRPETNNDNEFHSR